LGDEYRNAFGTLFGVTNKQPQDPWQYVQGAAPVPPDATASFPPVPPARESRWRRLPLAGKVALIVAPVLFLCCGGLTAIGALVGPPPQKAAPKPVNAGGVAIGHPDATRSRVPTQPSPSAAVTTDLSPSPSATSAAAPTTAAAPVTVTRTVTETQAIPYTTTRVNDASLASGTTKVRTHGVNGVRTLTYQVTLTNGVQTSKKLVSQTTTKAPVTQVVAVGTKSVQHCDPNYSGACVPIASDVDCAGGSGNGPAYVQGPVRVIGKDIYDLDSDGDGIGCED
jgi:hypothetical protein